MASQIASLKNAAGVEKGFPTLEETIPSESKGCEAPVLFRVPCNIPCSSMWISVFQRIATSGLGCFHECHIKDTKNFRNYQIPLPPVCTPVCMWRKSDWTGVKFDGQWKRNVWNFYLLSWLHSGTILEFRCNKRHLTADLGTRCPIDSNIWTCISIDVNFVIFLCRGKEVSVCTLLSILTIIGMYIRLDKHLWINSLLHTLRYSYRHKSWLPHK